MLEKAAKIMGVLAKVAAVVMVLLFVLSKMDLSFLFGPKTYDAEYVPGVYTPDGYVSTFLGYRFTPPEGYDLSTIEERAQLSNVAVNRLSVSEMEEQMKKQSTVVDLYAYVPATQKPHVLLTLEFEKEISKKDLETVAEELSKQSARMGMNISGDFEFREFLGKECAVYTGYMNVEGTKVNQDYYIFVENGYAWMLAFTYLEGDDKELELLKDSFEIYE